MAAVKKQRIGDLLVTRGILTRQVAEATAVERVLSDTRFASTLIRKGKAKEADVLLALSEHFGLPAVDLGRAVLARSTLSRVPEAVARRHSLLPVQVDGSVLLVAMLEPAPQAVMDEVAFATGLSVLPLLALHFRLVEALSRAYQGTAAFYHGPEADPNSNLERVPIVRHESAAPAVAPDLAGDEPLDLIDPGEPVVQAPKPAATPAPASPAAVPKRVILVVDDEPDIQTLVAQTLKPLGHEVITAGRGMEALNLVKSRMPALIILDAMLPEVHGFEICRKVKESKRFAHTPVLMISAMYRGWRIAADIKSLYGADAFIEKPFRVDELRRTVERLLTQSPASAVDDEPGADAQAAYDTAVHAYKNKDLATAASELRKAEAGEPFSAKIQFMLGRVLEQQERPFQAIYHYERAVELNPSLFSAAKNLALLYEAKGFKNKAVEMWERALKAAGEPDVREQIKKHLVSIL